MRLLRLSATSAIAAAALALSLAGPASALEAAREAADCGLLCRLQGYLSADHMTAAPADEGPARAASKARHPRAASHAAARAAPRAVEHAAAQPSAHPFLVDSARKVQTARAPTPGVSPAPASKAAMPTVKTEVAAGAPANEAASRAPARPGSPQRADASHGAAAPARAKVAEAARPARAAAPPPAAPRRPAATPSPKPAAVLATARPAGPSPQARLKPPAGSTRTASLSATIPGSAPPMQAGFH